MENTKCGNVKLRFCHTHQCFKGSQYDRFLGSRSPRRDLGLHDPELKTLLLYCLTLMMEALQSLQTLAAT